MKGERLEGQHIEAVKPEREVMRGIGDRVLSAGKDEESTGVIKKSEAANLKNEVSFWSNEYNEVERQFVHYSKRLTPQERREENYRTALAKYEEDIAFNWQRMDNAADTAMSKGLIRSSYELADTQQLGIVEPHETVEAATGIFYKERIEALREKVEAAEQTEDVAAEKQLMRQTWRRVMDYIEASTDYDFLHRDYNSYQNARRTCHNNMIEQLNNLNLLAKKYETKPLTARNFMTNDFYYDARKDRSGRLNHRANYDRETVLAYFRTAFQTDFKIMDKKAQKLRDSLQPGMTYYD